MRSPIDGTGPHSPFSQALLDNIGLPNVPIQNVMKRVTGDVYRETNEKQRPWVNASLIGDVYLNNTGLPLNASETDTPAQPSLTVSSSSEPNKAADPSIAWEREKLIWEAAQKSGASADYKAYLSSYPNGHFADLARNAISRGDAKSSKEVAALAASPSRELNPANAPEMPGTPETEAMLGWDRNMRREVQTRLNLAGQNLGYPDGAFGNRTRDGIRAWQDQNRYPPTGYFNQAQYLQLVQQTSVQYSTYLAETQRQAASRPRVVERRHVVSRKHSNSSLDPAGAAFVGGLMGGLIGGAISH